MIHLDFLLEISMILFMQPVIIFLTCVLSENCNCFNIDAVAGPDGEDATLLSKPFEPFKTSTELSKEKRKITIGLPDVRLFLDF